MTFKKKANKDLRDEVTDILREKEEMRLRQLEAEAEADRDYVEAFRREQQREEMKLLEESAPDIQYFDGSE